MRPLNDDATIEQRARADRYWTEMVRPQMSAKGQAKAPEDPQVALNRIKAEGWGDVQVSDAILATLPNMKKGQAA
ncbi:hypothetical protein FHR70_003766 [Microvirga lupini]|uniref:Uncharacterized protein n=1 Tax=Microvirga lupini TaxID=420324 RepID=A0A7W4VNY3_9HYPH|nr:hypothetical protein [Microvirga lupini]MBB3020680.1 hypothetical protein [Microvirga lupini]